MCECHDDYDTEDWDQNGFKFEPGTETESIYIAPETLGKLNTLREMWGLRSVHDVIGRLADGATLAHAARFGMANPDDPQDAERWRKLRDLVNDGMELSEAALRVVLSGSVAQNAQRDGEPK